MQISQNTSNLNSSYLVIVFIYSEKCYKVRSHSSGLIQGVGQAAQLIHPPSSCVPESLASARCFLTSFLPHKSCSGGCGSLVVVGQEGFLVFSIAACALEDVWLSPEIDQLRFSLFRCCFLLPWWLVWQAWCCAKRGWLSIHPPWGAEEAGYWVNVFMQHFWMVPCPLLCW